MKLHLIYKGPLSRVLAVVFENGDCPADEFLKQLERNDVVSHKSMKSILIGHADNGEFRNKQKSRVIVGRKNLLEFKTKHGDRLMYFYLPGHRTILTHGFHKGAVESSENNRAERIRDQYCREVENGR
jgi:hypothetical protein